MHSLPSKRTFVSTCTLWLLVCGMLVPHALALDSPSPASPLATNNTITTSTSTTTTTSTSTLTTQTPAATEVPATSGPSASTSYTVEALTSADVDKGHCVFGGNCGTGGGNDGYAVIPCHVAHRPNPLSASKLDVLRAHCPSLFDHDNQTAFCCSGDQVDEIINNMRFLGDLGMENCPSCFHNFKQMICQMSCSARQSHFIQVVDQAEPESPEETESSLRHFRMLASDPQHFQVHKLRQINYFLDNQFVVTAFESCKGVRSMIGSSSVIRLMCDQDNCSARDWLDFVGRHFESGGRSPMQINYLFDGIHAPFRTWRQVMQSEHVHPSVRQLLASNPSNLSNMTKLIPMNHTSFGCDQIAPTATAVCPCDDCEQTCKAHAQIELQLKHLTMLPDKQPLSWARQLTVSLGWALFVFLIGSFLVYVAILLLKAKRTYSHAATYSHSTSPLPDQDTEQHEEQEPLRQTNDFGNKKSEQMSQDKQRSNDCSDTFTSGSYREYVKRLQQEQQILDGLTQKGDLKLNLGLRLEAFFQRSFEKWGAFVACYPIPVMIVSLIVSIVLACGLSFYKVTTDPVDLWVASGSQARQDMQYFNDHFWKFYRIEQVILVPKNGRPFNGSYVNEKQEQITREFGAVFSQPLLIEALQLQTEIEQIVAKNERTGKQVKLSDICFQPLPGQCATQSIFTYFGNNVSKIQEPNYLAHIDICTKNPTLSGHVECMSKGGIPLIYPEASLGGFSNRQFHQSASLVLTFPVNNYNTADQNEDALTWEQEFLNLLERHAHNVDSNFSIAYKAEKSIEDELNRQSESDVVTIVVSYVIMFVYILLTLGDSGPICSLRTSRFTLGLVGVGVVLLSVFSSLGFFFYLGIPATLIIVEVIPFLVLAVGVDNIFILVQSFQRQVPAPHLPLHVEIGQLVGQVAPSMLLSSSSMCACFFIGAYTPMPAVQMFALYAAVALAINFFLQMTCFLAIFALDVRRQRANRLDILCCIQIGKPINANNRGIAGNSLSTASTASSGNTDHREVIRTAPQSNTVLYNNHCLHPNQYQSREPAPEQVGFLFTFFRDFYAPALMNDHVRLAIMALFAGLLCSSLIVISKIHVGLEQELTMPDDSYMSHYFETYQKQLQVGPPVFFMIQGNHRLSDIEMQNTLCSLNDCEPTSVPQMINYWAIRDSQNSRLASVPSYFLDNYIKFVRNPRCCQKSVTDASVCSSSSTNHTCSVCLDSNFSHRLQGHDFYRYLSYYLQELPNDKCILGGKAQFLPSVKFNQLSDVDNPMLEASYIMTYHTPLKTSEDFYEALRKSRIISDKLTERIRSTTNASDVRVRPYSLPHVFYEQYLSMWVDTVISLAMSIGSIFVVTYLFFGLDFYSASIVAFTITLIIINLLGLMYWWEISLNAISLVNLVVGVGISVEFCAHLLMVYKTSTEPTRKLRAQESLGKMGASILSGITLTDCGILVLAFAKSKIFQVFYFRMYLGIIVFGTVHSLLFLPVFLSIVGPPLNSDRLILQQIKIQESIAKEDKQLQTVRSADQS